MQEVTFYLEQEEELAFYASTRPINWAVLLVVRPAMCARWIDFLVGLQLIASLSWKGGRYKECPKYHSTDRRGSINRQALQLASLILSHAVTR